MVSFVSEDCGAGIGRVTSSLLLHFFDEVDLVEPSGMHPGYATHIDCHKFSYLTLLNSGHLLETARRNLVEIRPSAIPRGHVAGRFIQCGLEDFRPEKDRYDAIWVQWAFMYLTDGMLLHHKIHLSFSAI
jgi:protein N-terminal methyltransferase